MFVFLHGLIAKYVFWRTKRKKSKDIQSLASGPLMGVERFTGYLANGYQFHIKELEDRRKN